MKAILLKKFGGVEELYLGEIPIPTISENEVLVKVRATALNRADLLQRRGLYPPPPGESDIIGLEMAGEVERVGDDVKRWRPGDRVFSLLAGGGYAEYVKVHEDMLLSIPNGMSYENAAGIAEAFLTAWQAIVWLADMQPGETILIHAGASGVGTAAIQIAKNRGGQVIVTASAGKHTLCRELGADHCIDYRSENFVESIARYDKDMANVVIDFIGAPYFNQNLQSLATDGRMVLLGMMGGAKLEVVDLRPVLFKRLKIMGSTLRSRSQDYKIRLTRDFEKHAMPLIRSDKMKPVIDSVFDWENVKKAHTYMEANKNSGKVVLQVVK